MVETSYGIVIPCKDGAEVIQKTLRSLLSQTIKPLMIIVVDDASKDDTPKILERYPQVYTIRLNHDHPRNFARVPKLLNLGFKRMPNSCRYVMVSGDDTVYPGDYVEKIVECFRRNPRLKIASGRMEKRESKIPDKLRVQSETPQGTGRMFDYAFLKRHLPFPVSIGWESDILFKGMQEGEIKCFPEIAFKHTREYGSYSIRTFGHGAYVLGYPFLFFLARSLKTFVLRDCEYPRFKVFLQLLGYIEYFLTRQKRLPIADFVKNHLNRRLVRFVARIVKGPL